MTKYPWECSIDQIMGLIITYHEKSSPTIRIDFIGELRDFINEEGE